MKRYKLKYNLALDKGIEYQKIPNTPDFHNHRDALEYWKKFNSRIIEESFYNEPPSRVLVIRIETSIIEIEKCMKIY